MKSTSSFVTKQLLLLALIVGAIRAFSVPRHQTATCSKSVLCSNLRTPRPFLRESHSSFSVSRSSRIARESFLPAEASNENQSSSADKDDKTETTKLTRFKQSVGKYFRGSDKDDGLTTKQRLAKMGLATVLSYGWISNTNAMILLSAAWYVFCVRTGMSPLFPGQWKKFLGVYAGFYVVSNFLRPFRIAAAVAIGPYFDRFVLYIERKTGLPKAVSIFTTVFIVNFIGTLALMAGLISLASLVSGVPIFPPKGAV